jgi:hypothetical protein
MADYRECSKCGVEYEASQGHTCDEQDLAELAQAEAEDQEVREAGDGAKE